MQHPSLIHSPAWLPVALVVMAVLVGISLTFSWRAQQRVKTVEQELVARQGSSLEQTTEARMQAQQAQEVARASLAKLAVVELRLGEVSAQRGQLEELIAAASRPREESLIGDIDRALRMALQQGAVSGSAEPLVLALRQAEERLGSPRQPRLEPLRRAIARDLERARASGSADLATLTSRVDEAIRQVDDLPLLAAANSEAARAEGDRLLPGAAGPGSRHEPAAPSAIGGWADWPGAELGRALLQRVWGELRSLIRVTRIDHPEAMLLAPEQSFFLRENLKLRLLNARLALLSRQFDTARADLLVAEGWLARYFDVSSRRTGLVLDLLRQVRSQANPGSIVRPDDTLAALAAAVAR